MPLLFYTNTECTVHPLFKCEVIYSSDFVCALEPLLVRAHFQEHSWSLIIRGHGSHLGDGDVGLEALDFHIIWFDRQVCLAVGDVEGTRGRALCLGQLVLLLACLALCGSRLKNSGYQLLASKAQASIYFQNGWMILLNLITFGRKYSYIKLYCSVLGVVSLTDSVTVDLLI